MIWEPGDCFSVTPLRFDAVQGMGSFVKGLSPRLKRVGLGGQNPLTFPAYAGCRLQPDSQGR